MWTKRPSGGRKAPGLPLSTAATPTPAPPWERKTRSGSARRQAKALGCRPEDVVVAATGVIGQTLNVAVIEQGMPGAVRGGGPHGGGQRRGRPRHHDHRHRQRRSWPWSSPSAARPCRMGGIAKGSGMIHPNMGTMLCFLTTDCAITPEMLPRPLCEEIVPRTFNRVTRRRGHLHQRHVLRPGQRHGGQPSSSSGRTTDYTAFLQALQQLVPVSWPAAIAGRRRGRHASLHHLHRHRTPASEESAERRGQGGDRLLPGQGRHVRRGRQLGPGAVRHGLLQGAPSDPRARWTSPSAPQAGSVPGLPQAARAADFDEEAAKSILLENEVESSSSTCTRASTRLHRAGAAT